MAGYTKKKAGEVQHFNARLPVDLVKKVKVEAILQDEHTDDVVIRALEKYFEKKN